MIALFGLTGTYFFMLFMVVLSNGTVLLDNIRSKNCKRTHDSIGSHSSLFSLLMSLKNRVPLEKDYCDKQAKKYVLVMPNRAIM